MRILVLTTEPVDADAVRAAFPEEDVEGAEVLVVSPAVNESKLAFWVSDSDEAIAEAEEVMDATVGALREEGVRARGRTGEGEPLQALQDALATFPADRVLVLARADDEQRYREDEALDADAVGVPVTIRTL